LRIVQISDFHFTRPTWNPLRLFSKRIMGHFNWLLSRNHAFSENILSNLPHLFKDLNVDLVILGGDFTTTALKEEFKTARKFVDQLPAPWTAIPGNHDVYTYRSERKKTFYQFFRSEKPGGFGYSLAEDKLEVRKLDDSYWLITLDVCRATNWYSSRGLFSEKIEEKMKKVLSLIPSEDAIVISSHYPFFQHDAHRRTLKRGEALRKILENDSRIRLFLHGHTHRHTIADLQPSGLPVVLDSGSCAQKNRASWNLIDLKKEGCTVTAYQYHQGWKPSRTENITWKM
jgi:3',5'-cyclic AMP phosphodiesterase CpdA